MKIEFVNHASFLVEQGNIRLLIDPWLDGYAFYEGWALISKSKFSYEDFASVTHIGFSHEHPDHFSPPVLNKIPQDYRKKITILYQKTIDRKVVDVCRKMGFGNVIELRPEWVPLSNELKVYNKPHTDGDSWLCIKTPDTTLLNLNDCIMRDDNDVKEVKTITGNVDVLFTQFSYANWVGNKDDYPSRKKAADEKLEELLRQNRIIEPKAIVPYASYIWFCHTENFYLNDGVNKIDSVYEFISQNTNAVPVILYPGDKWCPSDLNFRSSSAIERYKRDWDLMVADPPLVKPKKIETQVLSDNAKKFAEELLKNNSALVRLLRPAKIYLEDYNAAFIFSLKNGLEQINIHPDYCDIILSSDALNYCFKYLWGGGTLRVNGRYQMTAKGNYFNFKMFFQVSQINNQGQKFDLKYVADQLGNKVRSKLIR